MYKITEQRLRVMDKDINKTYFSDGELLPFVHDYYMQEAVKEFALTQNRLLDEPDKWGIAFRVIPKMTDYRSFCAINRFLYTEEAAEYLVSSEEDNV